MIDEQRQNQIIRDAVVKQLVSVERRLAQGKGTWPQQDYVRDCIWDAWQGKRNALRAVLSKAGIDPDDLESEEQDERV